MFKNLVKTTARSIVKNFTHTIINIAGFAVGLTVVLLIMLWVDYHESFDKFHDNSQNIYKVMTKTGNEKVGIQTTAGGVYEVMAEAKENSPQIENMTRLISNWRWPSEQCFKIDPIKPCVYNRGIYADSSFFNVFDFKIINGAINPLVDQRSLALSESLASQLFGDENPIGKLYKIDNHLEVTITAIFEDVPATSSLQFGFVASLDVVHTLWMGNNFNEEKIKSWNYNTYLSLNSKKPNDVEDVINSVSTMAKYENFEYILQPLENEHLYSDFKNGKADGGMIEYIQMFILFAFFILLMSIVNFVNLSTARSTTRGKEIGIRKVTGATKLSIMTQFLFEALFKVTLATLFSVIAVYYLIPVLNQLIGEQILFTFDLSFILKILALVVFCSVFAGAYPAFVMTRFNPIKALKSKEGLSGGNNGLRKWLTVIQIGISIVIIIVTSVIFLQLDFVTNASLGYDRKGIVMLEPTYQHVKNFDKFSNDLKANSLVQAIGNCNANLIDVTFASKEIVWPGKSEEDATLFKAIGADNGIFDVFNFPILDGTLFNEEDSLSQLIISKSAASAMGMEKPVGQVVTYYNKESRIIGVIEDFNTESLHAARMPVIIYKVKPANAGTMYIRYDKENPKESISFIEKEYSEYEKFITMKYKFLDEEYQMKYKDEVVTSKLASIVMIISILISFLGILGLSTFNVLKRFKEIGIRKVFGASIGQIIRLLSKDFIIIGLIANILAWPVAYYLVVNWLQSFAVHIEMPYELFGVSMLLSLFVIISLVSFQSFKASIMNPATIVREE